MMPSVNSKHLTICDCSRIIRKRFWIVVVSVIIFIAPFVYKGFSAKLSILIAGTIGFLAGTIVCCLLECSDTIIKTPEDVEACAKMPFLGDIPSADKETESKEEIDLISHYKPHLKTAQAFRNTKESLQFVFSSDKTIKTVVITSIMSGEGSSFVASNLAVAFAAAGEPTLLIDADMRRGRLAGLFNIKNKEGLTDVLSGICSWQEAVVSTYVPNLSLLPCGTAVSNMVELLNTGKLKNVLGQAEQKFKRVIIDSSPVLSVADTLAVASACDSLVFVVKAGCTHFKHILDAKKIAEKNVKVIGAILNNGPATKDSTVELNA